MNFRLYLSLIHILVFAFAACSSSNDAPASQGTTEQEVATDEEKEEPAADATEEKPVEPEQPTDAEDAQQQTITGTLVESAEDTVTIPTEDGQELTFSLSDDTDRSQTDGMLTGNTLEVDVYKRQALYAAFYAALDVPFELLL